MAEGANPRECKLCEGEDEGKGVQSSDTRAACETSSVIKSPKQCACARETTSDKKEGSLPHIGNDIGTIFGLTPKWLDPIVGETVCIKQKREGGGWAVEIVVERQGSA